MTSSRSIDKTGHVKRIDESIHELGKFDSRTMSPAPLPYQFVGTIIDNTRCLLTAPANSLDGKNRKFKMSDINNWLSLMQSVHRSFFSDIHIATEAGLAHLCKELGITPEIRINKAIEDVLDDIRAEVVGSPTIKKELKMIERKTLRKWPIFDDYLEAVLSKSKMSQKSKKIWRKFFKALSIVRNKVSHSDISLSEHEKQMMIEGGFRTLVSKKGKLQVNPRMYEQVCNYILRFFDELYSK